MNTTVAFRDAERKDVPLILQFIKEIAAYEKMSDQVIADETTLETWIFDKEKAEVFFVLEEGKEVGFALYFHNFSTFVGRGGIYLEDVYILPEYRGKGYGKAILKKLAAIAVERGCGRMEWVCLDWNQPSIGRTADVRLDAVSSYRGCLSTTCRINGNKKGRSKNESVIGKRK